jgi:hypothetical protein
MNLHKMYVFTRGADGLLYYKHNMADRQYDHWTDWQWLDVPTVGVTLDPPSVVAQENGRLDLFVRGQDNALWHRTFDGNRWSNWESLGGVLTSGPAAVVIR